MTKTKPTKKDRFNGLIGQTKAKRKLSFHLDNFDATKILPHMMFIAPKGCGKTFMAELLCKLLDKPYIPINCSTIKNIGSDRGIAVNPRIL